MFQIHFHLLNQNFQDVLKEKSAFTFWLKLKQLYMTKSSTNKLHLKQSLCSQCIFEVTSIDDHLTIFKEIVADLESIEVKYDDEDHELILPCLLLTSYMSFRDPTLYSHKTLIADEVYDALLSKEKMEHLEVQIEGLVVLGRIKYKNLGGNMRGRSKSKNKDKVCHYYKKKGHIGAYCYKLKNRTVIANQKEKLPKNLREASAVEDEKSDGGLLVISVGNSKISEDWILNSSVLFICVIVGSGFVTYEVVLQGASIMGNKSPCKIAGFGIARI